MLRRLSASFAIALFAFQLCVLFAPSLRAEDAPAKKAEPIKVLFLGDKGHHRPKKLFDQIEPVMRLRKVSLTYTENMQDISKEKLAEFDTLLIFANITEIAPEQEAALLSYVEDGKSLVALHCASFCFHNSEKYIALVGGQFKRHGTDTFRTRVANEEHPLIKGYRGFESWDETYEHHKHNDTDRTVLEYRQEEPWTWIRTQGKGRVFYTAWGHDERTWGNVGFHNLVERGIRWAVGADLSVVAPFADQQAMNPPRKDVAPFQYQGAKVPFYPSGPGRSGVKEGEYPMQLPLAADESQKHIITPVDFEPQLFVSEPMLEGKPLCMAWDHRGRLWVAESTDYPNDLQTRGRGRDRIRIFEDTDNDGKADKSTVFADKLSIPTSMAFGYGGVIIHMAPDTLLLRDTNGDDVVDERHTLFTGWGTGDTHAGPSNLNYGHDNWYYGIVGYSGFTGEIAGERQSFRQGFYRFQVAEKDGKPEVTAFEFLRNSSNNSWGVGISDEGILFGSTANGNPSMYLAIPNRYYERVNGWSSSVLEMIAESNRVYPVTDKIRQVDHHGGFTAAAGHAIYTARTYPSTYWNRTAFVSEPTGHLTATLVLTANGADFRSKNSWNLFASDDEWTAPVSAEVGPDGHVWVIDWYNYIVQHNPTPAGFQNGKGNAYETDLRDKKHGRIYRVVYTKAAPAKPFSLEKASTEQLVETLASDNLLWRRHAQRLLVERGNMDVVPLLVKMISEAKSDELGIASGAVHAIGTLAGLGAIEPANTEVWTAMKNSLAHQSPAVRRMAAVALPRTAAGSELLLASSVTTDSDAQTRLAALLAIADMPPSTTAARVMAQSLADKTLWDDRWLSEAATAAAATNAVEFIELSSAEAPSPRQQTAMTIIAGHIARSELDPASVEKILLSLEKKSPAVASQLLSSLSSAWPKTRKVELTEASENALVTLLAKLPAAERAGLIGLATRMGSKKMAAQAEEVVKVLQETLADPDATDAAKLDATIQLVEFAPQSDEIGAQVIENITPRTSPEASQKMLEALARSESPATAAAIIDAAARFTPTNRAAAIRVLLSRVDWTEALVVAMEEKKLSSLDLSLDQKQSLATHPNRRLASRATKMLAQGGGLPNADRTKVLDELMPLTLEKGNVDNGLVVFKKVCAKCHVHGSEGARIGPDLTGMAVHPKKELLTHIIDPSRSVEGNFRVYTLLTDDGRTISGLLSSESRTSVELIDAEGKKQVVQRDEIDQLRPSEKSLMPEGFEKQVTKTDIVDLLEFLTKKGKYLPLMLDKVATVVSTRGMFHGEEVRSESMIFDDWSPKLFEGIPFQLVDPQGEKRPNAILLYGPNGEIPPKMPRSVALDLGSPATTIHLLSGVSGWGFPLGTKGSTSMIVRLVYADGSTEDHPLKNGEHFSDYIRREDVPGSKYAFNLRGKQLRYVSVTPAKQDAIAKIELVKGNDATAPVVMAITAELPTTAAH